MIEITQAELDTAWSIINDVQRQMDNYLPAKGESSAACERRRTATEIAEALATQRVKHEEALAAAEALLAEAREVIAPFAAAGRVYDRNLPTEGENKSYEDAFNVVDLADFRRAAAFIERTAR